MNWLSRLLHRKGDVPTYSIPGGISPRRAKSASLRSRIMPMPLPKQLVLELKQRSNTPLKPVVSVGEFVKKYQLLAEPNSIYDMPLYAPCSGQIKAVQLKPEVDDPIGLSCYLTIATDSADSECPARPLTDLELANGETLLTALQNLAVGGLGGAGFSASIKLKKARAAGVSLLIINGAECEPYISCDEALLRERAPEVIAGAKLLQKACGAERCVIAIESHKKAAIAAVRDAQINNKISLAIIATKYPAGSEKQLIQAVTNQQVPHRGNPLTIGVVVLNVGTAYSAFVSLTSGQPNIGRITTLAGGPLRTPKNFEVLYGAPVSFLQELCGIDSISHSQTFIGGPLMGESILGGDAYINRAANCVIAADVQSFPKPSGEIACIRCGDCAEVCPAKLLPQQLYSFARSQNAIQLDAYHLTDCIECGACSYVCPSKIPLVDYFKAGKYALSQEKQQQDQSEAWQERFQSHQIRIKVEKDAALSKRNVNNSTKATQAVIAPMSRATAQSEIAAAVARVNSKKAKLKSLKRTE